MFCLNDSTRYFLCPGSTDMRKGMFSLSGLIREKMNGDVRNGDVYIFINRLKNRIKLLHAETGGLVMYEKLLEEGTFKIPAYDPETHSYPMTWSDLVIIWWKASTRTNEREGKDGSPIRKDTGKYL